MLPLEQLLAYYGLKIKMSIKVISLLSKIQVSKLADSLTYEGMGVGMSDFVYVRIFSQTSGHRIFLFP